MEGKFEIEHPGSVLFTLTMTMTLGEWTEIAGSMRQDKARTAVASTLLNTIGAMVNQAETKHEGTTEVNSV